MSDSLALEAVDRHLRGRFGRPYAYVESCESTQQLLGADAPEGAVAVADLQTAGRGRYGRAWEAPAGTSLLCTVVVRPPAGHAAPEVTLVGAVAAARAVEAVTGLAAQIKWPNDVMLDRRKVAGVLGELRDGVVLLGIGINVNQTPAELPPDARVAPGSLRSVTGATYGRAALLGVLLCELERAYDRWHEGGLDAIFEEIGPRDFLRGRMLAVDGKNGRAVGITRDGALAIETGHGERLVVTSGEVAFER